MTQGLLKKRHAHKQNILLVNITRLGDMLQATPTIAGMKMENPDCRITVLVEKQFAGICEYLPNIDEIVSIDLAYTVRNLAREQDGIVDAFEYVGQLVDDLRMRNFDYVLNMSSSAYTALLLNLLKVPRRGGWSSDHEGYRVIESEWARLFATSVFHQNRQYNSLNLVDVFRCSADVEQHPESLIAHVPEVDRAFAQSTIAAKQFTNTGPLIAIQAGASQGKRQWNPAKFVQLIQLLHERLGARVLLTGTAKELPIIESILAHVPEQNVLSLAGKTSISQLCALLEASDILITGDTGPMHISVAVGTPVISMFLASAYGFETGPYGKDHIVLQPVIGCGPCNPNKPCSRPDCHDHITPELLVELSAQRIRGPIEKVSPELADPRYVIVYRSTFDEWGFYDLESLNGDVGDPLRVYRNAYRKVWLSELGGLPVPPPRASTKQSALALVDSDVAGIHAVVQQAERGVTLIGELERLVRDERAPASQLGRVSDELSELDRAIEELGYHHSHLGPVTRMFVFGKENLSGTDPLELASQMRETYSDLAVRSKKLGLYLGGH